MVASLGAHQAPNHPFLSTINIVEGAPNGWWNLKNKMEKVSPHLTPVFFFCRVGFECWSEFPAFSQKERPQRTWFQHHMALPKKLPTASNRIIVFHVQVSDSKLLFCSTMSNLQVCCDCLLRYVLDHRFHPGLLRRLLRLRIIGALQRRKNMLGANTVMCRESLDQYQLGTSCI